MFVQMCVKGVNGISRDQAKVILERGLACAWWRNSTNITSAEINRRLTREELDLHVHSFEEKHPGGGGLVRDQSQGAARAVPDEAFGHRVQHDARGAQVERPVDP